MERIAPGPVPIESPQQLADFIQDHAAGSFSCVHQRKDYGLLWVLSVFTMNVRADGTYHVALAADVVIKLRFLKPEAPAVDVQ